jgi:hypothetical protein
MHLVTSSRRRLPVVDQDVDRPWLTAVLVQVRGGKKCMVAGFAAHHAPLTVKDGSIRKRWTIGEDLAGPWACVCY